MSASEKPISLSELIFWVKKELLSDEIPDDPAPLFVIDEITVEVNFVVTGAVRGGFSLLKVVEAGSEVSEDRVQKAVIKMAPIVPREQIIDELRAEEPETFKEIKKGTRTAILKGRKRRISTTPSRSE